MTTLRAVLEGARPDPCDTNIIRSALRLPWCWPRGQHQIELSGELFQEPPPPDIGQVILVSATEMVRRGIWTARRWTERELARRGDADSYPLHSAPWLTNLERGDIARSIPFLLGDPSLHAGEWRAGLVAREGRGTDTHLSGTSYGVAVALGLASMHMAEPVPQDLIASAEIKDGKLHPVDGLDQKIPMVWNWAPGVSRFMVAQKQKDEATEIAKRLAPGLDIVAAETLAQAMDIAFPGFREKGPPRWQHLAEARTDAEKLHQLALRSPSILDWSAVERPAGVIASILEPGSAEHRSVTFALSVARRHQGKPGPLPWLQSGDGSPPHLKELAHVIQSATDSGNPDLREWIGWAWAYAGSGRSDPEKILMGAIGRAQAVLGDLQEAKATLGKVVAGWREESKLHEASRAVCELLRVVGLMGDAQAFRALVPLARECRERCEEHAPGSVGYLRLAEGRAWVHLGQHEEALGVLHNDDDWIDTDEHLQRSRMRWYSLALDQAGRHVDAREKRKTLACPLGTPPNPFLVLSQLDVLLQEPPESPADGELSRLLDLLAEIDPSANRLRQREAGASTRLQARCVAREYPY